ncbi:MAG: GNAT family N-acetyltransferase [Clostridiaceae bacterium]|nr:GNAT family N-acetyltransferase [Clostridiaceae bacterium]
MLDKSIPFAAVLMTKHDIGIFPRYRLPAGYRFCLYRAGMEQDWARLQAESGQVDGLDAAETLFRNEFLQEPDMAARQCLFVADEHTAFIAATASLWFGDHFGERHARIHWVTVDTAYQGRGLAKALLSRLLEQHQDQSSDWLYLTTQTWSYKAIGLYRRFGFLPYRGPKPVNWKSRDEDFIQDTGRAWDLIEHQLAGRA